MREADIYFDTEKQILTIEEPDGTSHTFTVTMLREVKELLSRYNYANFCDIGNIDEFHQFVFKMGELSPEVKDVESPYLN
jgi:hypothetical protein